ncbi:MAG: toprim domain-containing protein [Oscillospiraceae bacterium]|nr:toprim domain-containing protein [Oscillospiraceae bacterium]
MPTKKDYTNTDMTKLVGADKVRKRPGVIFGSDGLEGCQHSVFEILSNSVDEAREGHGDRVIVTRYLDHSIAVQDFGRGCPVDWNERENCFNWELAFCELYAGGKYDTNSGGSYTFSLGLNGLGLTATQQSSEWMNAEIFRDGYRYALNFEKGNIAGDMQKEPTKQKQTGSRFHWKPDLEVFTEIDIPLSFFEHVMRRQSVVNSSVRFILRHETEPGKFEEIEYFYENGIVDYIKEIAGDALLTDVQYWEAQRQGRDRADHADYRLEITLAVAFSKSKTLKEYYHNSSFLEHGGAPDKAAQSAFVGFIDGYLKQQGKYNKTDPKVKFQDILDCMLLVISSRSSVTSYENQTKKAINNKFIQEAMAEFIRHQMEVYFLENPLDAEKVADQIIINMRSRVKAEQTRVNIKKTLQSGNSLTNRVQKFVDCRSRDTELREIYIVEGDSALGACKQARDSEFQAIIPVRGKILNCLKSDYGKIFKNEIITDLIKVLGCGVEVTGKSHKELSSFDLNNLNWSKVIICTDADVDGFQIRTLILTMIYRLMPTLIEAGKVYIAESPLYEINSGSETWFAYNEQEKAQAFKELEGKRYTIQRSKGLGENDADMMSLTTMNPATRRLVKVCPTDAKATADMFDLMEGDNLAGRKAHIANHGHKWVAMADVS